MCKALKLKAGSGRAYDTELEYVCTFYKDDVNMLQLQTQLPLLKPLIDKEEMKMTISEITQQLAGWIQATLVMPAMNATSKHSFSAL